MQIVDGWLDVAVEVDVLENSMSRQGYKPTHIVLHGTAGGTDAVAIGKYFQSTVGGQNPASSHFIIGQDGTIVQCVSCDAAAWGNGGLDNPSFPFPANVNPNYYTISIEHCKPSEDNSDSLTDAQAQASFQLVQFLCDTYGIPKRAGDATGGIISHADLDSVNRARCPGLYPWAALWAFLGGANNVGIPNGWKDDGTTLTAKNGVPMQRGFRNAVLTASNWDPDNVPQEPEYAANPAQLHRPDLGAGTRQVMRDGVFWWTDGAGVIYEQFVGLELDAAYQQLTSANTKVTNQQQSITALQQQVQLFQSGKPLEDLQQRLKQINSLSTI